MYSHRWPLAGGFCAQSTRNQAVHDRVEHLDARQLPRRFHRHHLVGQTPFVKTALLGEGGHVQPLKRPLRDGLFRCRHSQSLLFGEKLRSRPRRRLLLGKKLHSQPHRSLFFGKKLRTQHSRSLLFGAKLQIKYVIR